MDDRLNQTLDEIIITSESSKQNKNKNITSSRRRREIMSNSNKIRANNSRNTRKNDPYNNIKNKDDDNNNGRMKLDDNIEIECSIKFLLSNSHAGSIIGNGGFAIKDLMEISGAIVRISDIKNLHPITNQRVLYIAGSESSVALAQALVWEMIGQQTSAYSEGKMILKIKCKLLFL